MRAAQLGRPQISRSSHVVGSALVSINKPAHYKRIDSCSRTTVAVASHLQQQHERSAQRRAVVAAAAAANMASAGGGSPPAPPHPPRRIAVIECEDAEKWKDMTVEVCGRLDWCAVEAVVLRADLPALDHANRP